MRAIGFGLQQGFKQTRGLADTARCVPSSEVAERASDIAFAHPGGASKEHVLVMGEPVLGAEFQEQLFV